MNPDLIRYLSFNIPLGIYLIPFAGIFFTIIWISVWKGTGFWNISRFWRILFQGWTVIIVGYLFIWLLQRPPPIPRRVVITLDATDTFKSTSWIGLWARDLLARRLRAAPEPFVVYDYETAPILKFAENGKDSLEDICRRLRAQLLVTINIAGDQVMIKAAHIKSKSVLNRWRTSGQASTVGDMVSLIEEAARRLGATDKAPVYLRYPRGLSIEHIRRLYSFIGDVDEDYWMQTAVSLAKLIGDMPAFIDPRFELARHLFEHQPGTFADSIRNLLISVTSDHPERSDAYVLLGRWSLEFRRWQEAESALKLALHYDNADPRTLFYLSRLDDKRLTGLRWSTKTELLRRSLDLAPGYETARLALARWWVASQESRRALELLADGLFINPQSLLLLKSKSAAELELSLNSEAARTARRLIAIDSTHSGGWYNLGLALIRNEDYDEAIAAFEKAYQLGGSADNLFYIGVAYQKIERFPEAVRYYQLRMANPTSAVDRIVESCRRRIQMLRRVMAERDSLGKGIKNNGDLIEAG